MTFDILNASRNFFANQRSRFARGYSRGISRVSQIEENVAALANLKFTADELAEIDHVLAS